MIAVAVLTYNRVHLLRKCVENVLDRASDATTEIVIWNNASTDGTREYLESLDNPRLRVVNHDENVGQNAYARAFALTSAEYMIELDDDVIDAPHGWDRTLLDAYVKLPRVGFLAANLVDDEHDTAARIMHHERADQYTTVVEHGVTLLKGPTGGGCAMTARELNERVGGFKQAKKHVFWLEDAAYVADIEKLGYEAAFLKDLSVHHAGGPYYAEEVPEKHSYWSEYWKTQKRKALLKKVLLRMPLVGRLNARFSWFAPPA